MSEFRSRQRNAPGVPSPGQDYTAATGMTPEQRAEIDIGALAAEKAAEKAAAKPQSGGDSAKEVAQLIAAALGEVVSVAAGGGRKPVNPQLLAHRRATWEKMVNLLEEYKAAGEKMTYELVDQPLFIDDILIPPTYMSNGKQVARRINFFGIPNEYMIPQNEPAKRVHALYLEAIGGKTPDLGDVSYNAYLNRPRMAEVIGEPVETPMLGTPGGLKESTVEILEDTPMEERRYLGPRKQMGTVIPEVGGGF